MKKLLALLSFLTGLMTFFTASAATLAAPEWVFDNEETLNGWSFKHTSKEIVDGVLKMVVSDWDPLLSHTLTNDEKVDCSTYKYIAFNMSASTSVEVGGLFFGTSVNPGPKGPEFSEFQLVNNGEWHDYIIDMTSYDHGLWEGTLTNLRLDPQNFYGYVPAEIYMGRLGVFKTEEEAKAFLAKQVYPEKNVVAEPKWIFNGGSDAELWQTHDSDYFDTLGVASYNVTGGDARLYILLNSIYNEKQMIFNADEYKYFAVRYNATSADDKTERDAALFFSTDPQKRSFNEQNLKEFVCFADSEYHNEIIDMSQIATWTGDITAVRLDMINRNVVSDNYIISRVGFFKTQEEAQAFLDAASPEDDSTDFDKLIEYRTDDMKLVIPANTLANGYNLNDYLLSSTEIDGNGDSAVAVYTDNAGNEKIVPLSDVNVAGYARYVAAKPGKYSLKFNSKNFDDIGGHWGEEYIKYLSAREIFGGTSPTEFSPEMPLTRGMFITALGRMHGVETEKYSTDTGYADVNSGEYYAPYINWSKENGILPSVSETAFTPEENITRADMALAIDNYIKISGFKVKPFSMGSAFDDLDTCTDAQKTAILNIQDKGIINGVGDKKFNPDGVLTRAEAATVLTRLIKGVVGANYATRFDRSKFIIGAFGYGDYLCNEKSVAEVVDMDLDYIMAYKANTTILRLFEEYNVGFIPNTRLELWLGANGSNAGTYAVSRPKNEIGSKLEKAPQSEAIIGDYMVDEPSAKDFESINAACNEYIKQTDGKLLPFVNLYPNYGSTQPENNPNALSQLGTSTYLEHIEQYVEKMDLDYICLDHYPMQSTGCFATYLQNLDEVGAACRDNDLSFWMIIQTGTNYNSEKFTAQKLEWQMYTCMAYGTTGIIHAVYADNWWHESTKCVNGSGETTPTYTMAKNANEEIHRFSDLFMQYDYKGTYATGYKLSTDGMIASQLSAQNARAIKRNGKIAEFDGITVDSNGGCLIGAFEKYDNVENKALMLVNCRNPYYAGTAEQAPVDVTLTLTTGKTVTAYENGYPTTYTANVDGEIVISIPAGEGVFVTVDK